ncbi:hypothetical protein [Nocardia terpenica]|uniref:Uncharacterized protein n=2 Tax=Nocardia terpenica TaxID=455432 RepID=A0A291RF20_9NOCA|nr:hypothetical protein [Nocardia terpenica]ATL65734.1 hypothetical protein CRH09_05415 [Nocardia terpenica]
MRRTAHGLLSTAEGIPIGEEKDMTDHRTPAVPGYQEILDFFGKCPECGYPARAAAARRGETTVLAFCDRPCGWSDTVPLTTMTAHGARGTTFGAR